MDRSIAPKTIQPKELNITIPEKLILQNNIELYWIKDVKDESVKIEMVWEAGTKYQNHALISSLTNRMLLDGTARKSSNQIAEEIDGLGGYFQRNVDKDHGEITLFGLRENTSAILSVFTDAFLYADFPEKELEKEVSISKESFKVDMEKVGVLCHRKFNQSVFGTTSPYGQVAELVDYENVKANQLREFYRDYYLNARPTFFIVGNVNQEVIEALKTFSGHFSGKPKVLPEIKLNSLKGKIHLEKEGAIQSALRVGRLMFDKSHPDYFGFQVLNTILGGYFGSRLMANIREDKGYTYGIGSGLAVLEQCGYFFISTQVGSEVREDAISEIFKEINKLVEEEVTEEELNRVKNYLIGDFLRQSDGPNAMMECFKNIYFNKLPISYYNDFIMAINLLDAGEIKRIAKEYFVKEEMLIVSAG